MAKKKKKAAKKTAKKKASGAAAAEAQEAGSCSDQNLETAAVVNAAGEGLVRLAEAFVTVLEARGIDISELVNAALASLQHEDGGRRIGGEENADRILRRCRDQFVELDYTEMPYLRVVGKVVEVLTIHRRQSHGKDSCSIGDVFRIFLTEIPQHSPYAPEEYRLVRPTSRGNEFDLTRNPGKTMFSDRLKDLKKHGWLTPAAATRSGGERGYRLSGDGRWLFDGWPDVDGLSNTPPTPQSATE
jgi:hypothetical protein